MDNHTQAKPEMLYEGVWNLTPGMSASYLIIGSEKALLIDTGFGNSDIPALISGITKLPVTLINTHCHGDHIGGNKYFDSFYMHKKDSERLQDEELKRKAIPVSEGHIFELGGLSLEVIELPGHTPGSIAVLDRTRKLIFTGDMVSEGLIFMVEGERSFEDFIASMDRLMSMSGEVESIICCHGKSVMPLSHTAKQKQAAEDFLAGKLTGVKSGEGQMNATLFKNREGYGFLVPIR